MFKAYFNYWKNYFNFTGKSSNADYWWAFLVNYLIGIIWWLIVASIVIIKFVNWIDSEDMFSHSFFNDWQFLLVLDLIGQIWIAVNFIPNLSIMTRRLRDAGFHWGLVFISAIPNAYFLIYRIVHLIMAYGTNNSLGATGTTMTLLNTVYTVVGLSCYIIMIVLCTRPTQSFQGQTGAGFTYQNPAQAQGVAGQAFPYATQMPTINQYSQMPQQSSMPQGQANPFVQPQSSMPTFQQVQGENSQQPAQYYQQANLAPQPQQAFQQAAAFTQGQNNQQPNPVTQSQQTMQTQVGTPEVQPAISEQVSPVTSEASQMSENS